jgi:hypothetical protein
MTPRLSFSPPLASATLTVAPGNDIFVGGNLPTPVAVEKNTNYYVGVLNASSNVIWNISTSPGNPAAGLPIGFQRCTPICGDPAGSNIVGVPVYFKLEVQGVPAPAPIFGPVVLAALTGPIRRLRKRLHDHEVGLASAID